MTIQANVWTRESGLRAGTVFLRAIGGGLVSPALGLMLLAATTVIALLVLRVRQSGLGNRLLAVRSNESAAAAAAPGALRPPVPR